jgi:hypothetical protein
MIKIIFTTTLLFIVTASYAATAPVNKDPQARDFMVSLPGTAIRISLEEYLTLSPAEYKAITGKKMKLTERFKMKFSQRAFKKFVRKDGSINMEKAKRYGFLGRWEWHWGGFALGFFFNIFGAIAALFFSDEYKWDRFWTALQTALIIFGIAGIVLAAL